MTARCVDCLNEAIERCEVTGVPLCAAHLWYVDDGRRVSERVARQIETGGRRITPPEKYLTKLGGAMALPRLPSAPRAVISVQRNANDIIALLAMATGIVSIATCFGVGVSLCMPAAPILPLILGAIGLAGSKSATRPDQARTFSWVGIIAGGSFVIIVVALSLLTLLVGAGTVLPFFYTPTRP